MNELYRSQLGLARNGIRYLSALHAYWRLMMAA